MEKSMNEKEVEDLAEELAADLCKIEQLKKVEEDKKWEKFNQSNRCPCCSKGYLRKTSIKDIRSCGSCFTHIGKDYQFYYPLWAQPKKAFFRRALCHIFNIQGVPPLQGQQYVK